MGLRTPGKVMKTNAYTFLQAGSQPITRKGGSRPPPTSSASPRCDPLNRRGSEISEVGDAGRATVNLIPM